MTTELSTFYLKLKYGLDGYYVKFRAPSSEYVAAYAEHYFGPIGSDPTCIYTEAYFYEIVRKREQKTRIIRRNDPIVLPIK